MRYLIFILLYSTLAHGQALMVPRAQSEQLSVVSVTTTDATKALVVPSNSKVCLDGTTCTKYILYSDSDAAVTIPDIKSSGVVSSHAVKLQEVALGTCSASTVNQLRVETGTGGSGQGQTRVCVCIGMGDDSYQWRNILNPTYIGASATACPPTEG